MRTFYIISAVVATLAVALPRRHKSVKNKTPKAFVINMSPHGKDNCASYFYTRSWNSHDYVGYGALDRCTTSKDVCTDPISQYIQKTDGTIQETDTKRCLALDHDKTPFVYATSCKNANVVNFTITGQTISTDKGTIYNYGGVLAAIKTNAYKATCGDSNDICAPVYWIKAPKAID